jgi:hypothetical protein
LHLGPALLDTRGAGHLFSPDQREAAGETLDPFFEILEVERLVSPMKSHLASNGAFKTVLHCHHKATEYDEHAERSKDLRAKAMFRNARIQHVDTSLVWVGLGLAVLTIFFLVASLYNDNTACLAAVKKRAAAIVTTAAQSYPATD